jgi:glycosyltransferase involved in cell wall biosynthesis
VNLALLIGHFPPGAFGGAELQAEAWAERLAVHHRVTVLTRRDPEGLPVREVRAGFTVERLPVSRVPGWRTFADLAAIDRAVATLSPRPDLLLCFQTFISGLAGTRTGARLGIPAVVWIRGEAEYRLADSRFYRLLSPRVWAAAAGLLVQSEANRVALLAELERAAPWLVDGVGAKLDVVENGIALPDPSPAAAAGPVLSVGRLIADKGMDLVIEACAASGRALVIAGEGPEREALAALAASQHADVRFEGFVNRARLDQLYREASAVVLAARRGEGLPNVLLEGLAHERPVLATPCAGTPDLLTHDENGWIVPVGESGPIAAALRRLAAEPATAGRLALAGRATAERFEWSRVQPRLEATLERRRRA